LFLSLRFLNEHRCRAPQILVRVDFFFHRAR
jgi:hypothetical protein